MEQQDTQQQGKVWYVEELRSTEEYPAGDAWVSITDAARITRTSEAMARRWVSSGRIPAKKEPVGINSRTRLVRLSDVAQIRPIIDPSAAITDDVRLIDLPSIPRQMQEIMESHEHLLAQTQTLQTSVEEIHQAQQSLQETFATQIQQLTTSFTEQMAATIKLVEGERERVTKLATWMTEQDQALGQRLDETSQRLTSELETVGANHQQTAQRLDTLVTAFEQHTQTFNTRIGELSIQMQRLAVDLPTQVELVRTTILAQFEQQVKDIFTEIHQVAQDEAHDAADFTKRHEQLKRLVENVATKTEAAMITAMAGQRRMDESSEQIADLRKQLNEERSAREILTQQVQVLLQHVNATHLHTPSATSTPRKRKTTTES